MPQNNYPMAQAASQHKWSEEEDGYSKHPHPHIIDWDNQWLVVGWTWGQRHLTCNLPRWKLGITRTPMNHGSRRCPTAAMVSHSRRRGIQQSSNMLCDKSTSWNLYYLFNLHDASLMHHVYFHCPRRCHKERPIWRLRCTRYAAIFKGCIWTMFFCRGRAKRCLEELKIAPPCNLLHFDKFAGHSAISRPHRALKLKWYYQRVNINYTLLVLFQRLAVSADGAVIFQWGVSKNWCCWRWQGHDGRLAG